MSEVKTYAVNCNDAWLNTDGDDISGSYVKYKDHQEVVAALEAKCAALAAENGKLKEFISLECMVFGDSGNLLVAEPFIHQAQDTDAFLAEVERKAIRKFINSIEHILRDKLSPYDTEEMLEAMRIFLEEQSGEQK